ncbi:alpha/beta fold hydrolase [Euzebya tangerina]|uniref:alpha/beta fold hydrolase n=1 Tax=Euzebya tangerina TaxID=591198 RepID=UPI000E30D169|nr:alpha/beta hydrolase [Euzebya tangerina]
MKDNSTMIDIGHTEVAYRRSGAGPDLLFIHGWPLNGDTWRGVVPTLSEEFTCHVIDLPGAGGSVATAATPLSIRGHVESVQAVMDQLSLTGVALFGQNSGGMVARRVASARPEHVTALVLSGTEIPGHNSWQLGMFVHGTRLPGAHALFRRAIGLGPLRRSRLLFGGTVADVGHLDGEFHDLFVRPLLEDDVLWDSQFTVLETFNLDDVDELAAVQRDLSMPTLLLWGAQDPFFPAEKARVMASQFAGSTTFESLPGGSLLVHDEHAEWFAQRAAAFLHEVLLEEPRV